MRLFRRRPAEPGALRFTVGVDGHRVVVGGAERGCALLDGVDAYVDSVAERAGSKPDGRDSVALQSAKMDYAEMVDAMVSVLSLTLEELVERGVMDSGEVPEKPALGRLDRNLGTYDYIQAAYGRARQRVGWAQAVDELLRSHDVAVLWPAAPD